MSKKNPQNILIAASENNFSQIKTSSITMCNFFAYQVRNTNSFWQKLPPAYVVRREGNIFSFGFGGKGYRVLLISSLRCFLEGGEGSVVWGGGGIPPSSV